MLVQALAEAVGHPLLKRVFAAFGLERRPQVGAAAADQLDRSELADYIEALEGVLKELVVPVDPGLPRPLEEFLLHDLMPEIVHLLHLGEETVAAEVEAVSVPDLSAGQPADLARRLKHDHRLALLGEQVPGG